MTDLDIRLKIKRWMKANPGREWPITYTRWFDHYIKFKGRAWYTREVVIARLKSEARGDEG